MTAAVPSQRLALGEYEEGVAERLKVWLEGELAERLMAKDPSLWPRADEEEVRHRLGWVDLPRDGLFLLEPLEELVRYVQEKEIERVILIGMGGSSLAPEVFAKTTSHPQAPVLTILDSTHPDVVRRVIDEIDSEKFLFVVSSKSGSTLETEALFQACWHAHERWHSQSGLYFIAITDSGSHLEAEAKRRGFYQVFASPGDVGGRFSALSVFGLVPAVLCGVRIEEVLARSRAMADICAKNPDNPGLELGAAIAELALAGRDKLTLFCSEAVAPFGDWFEQLLAESLGKDGGGIVPIVGEQLGDPAGYGDDRAFVIVRLEDEDDGLDLFLESVWAEGHPVIEIKLRDVFDLGAEFFRWEVAVAAASTALEVQPFDQPDVERTKRNSRQALAGEIGESGAGIPTADAAKPDLMRVRFSEWLEEVKPGDYFCIQAFLAPSAETDRLLDELRDSIRCQTGVATTCGYGPRYLHSTGQLHKGGSNRGLFLQLVDRPGSDLLVPEEDYSFGTLIGAQALGEAVALKELGRRLLRLELGPKPQEALALVAQLL